jgi:hypothetical protein
MSEQKIQELTNKLVMAQSKSFEMLAQLTEERNQARNQGLQLQELIDKVATMIGSGPTQQDFFDRIGVLIKNDALINIDTGKTQPAPEIVKPKGVKK